MVAEGRVVANQSASATPSRDIFSWLIVALDYGEVLCARWRGGVINGKGLGNIRKRHGIAVVELQQKYDGVEVVQVRP